MPYIWGIKQEKGQKMSFGTRKYVRQKLRDQYGKNPADWQPQGYLDQKMEDIRTYHEIEQESTEHQVDDVTWNDLEMDAVFERINHTRSYLGEQILYHKLHTLECSSDEESAAFEKRIRYYDTNEDKRLVLEEKLYQIGKRKTDYTLPYFLKNTQIWRIGNQALFLFLQIALIFLLAASIITDSPVAVAGLIGIVAVNIGIYSITRQRYEVYLFSLGSLKGILDFAKWMMKDETCKNLYPQQQTKEALAHLHKLSKMISVWQTRKYQSMSGDVASIFQDYLMGITLYDIVAFNRIMKLIEDKREDVMTLYCFAGTVDMEIAVASYRRSLEYWCIPEFTKEHVIRGHRISHPLVNHPVSNDFTMSDRAIITGANASGKSTFMKAVAVNVILVQNIHTCIADDFCILPMEVMTSMALRDDVITGESYYMREIRYLKRMLGRFEKKEPVLFVIDEILKGTNTAERIAASEAILDYFAKGNQFVLIATHDMELVYAMQGKYDNYYFDSVIQGKDVCFPYMIQKGIGGKTNAIELLDVLSYPEEIITRARKNLERSKV